MNITMSSQINETRVLQVLQELISYGTREFCICPGSRNSPFVQALTKISGFTTYYWFEERSAAFFALGRSRALQQPVAIITTSGTASGELLPAAMEAHYTGVPLVLITADRPRRYRGTGAPQTAEQAGLFGVYVRKEQDLADEEVCLLEDWDQTGPLHLNICFEEPLLHPFDSLEPFSFEEKGFVRPVSRDIPDSIDRFFSKTKRPFIIVGGLKPQARKSVADFLLQLQAPVFLEGISGLREEPSLQHLRLKRTDKLWQEAHKHRYPIDGVFRIGGVPTFRFWRDLEIKESELEVLSVNEVPFSGLSWGRVVSAPLAQVFSDYKLNTTYDSTHWKEWKEADTEYMDKLHRCYGEEPHAEPSLIHALSRQLPAASFVYLGNSLPIRNWDLAADNTFKGLEIQANRGVNGIDGQISTFLGLCRPDSHNWGLFGDLTTLYDMAAPWILSQLPHIKAAIVVINNGEAKSSLTCTLRRKCSMNTPCILVRLHTCGVWTTPAGPTSLRPCLQGKIV